jgi:L-galactono-1,4-lactone dehydrogenase
MYVCFVSFSVGSRRDDSINILGFDCGGEQWVLEVCFNIGPLPDAVDDKAGVSQSKDLEFVRRLLEVVEKNGVPAPSPIEQRWTARSTSPMVRTDTRWHCKLLIVNPITTA